MTKQHTPLLRSFAFIVVAFALCDSLRLASSQTSDYRLPAAPPNAPKSNCIPPPLRDQPKVLDTKTFTDGVVAYRGVTFIYGAELASAVIAEKRSASPLECDTDKPDGIHPEYIAFIFKGTYAADHDGHLQKYDSLENESSFFSPPEIGIYPVEGYKQAFSVSKDMVAWTEKQVKSLRKLSSQRIASFAREIPVLPWIEPSPDFQTRVKRLAFASGRGIFFLTHYNPDGYALINNQGMGYLFQGLTSDGRYYISGLFPVRAQFLPKDRSVEEADGFDPVKEYRPGDTAFKKKYAVYRASVVKRLKDLSANRYDPDLTSFEKLIGSLKIENQR